jgi:hypothetical protein
MFLHEEGWGLAEPFTVTIVRVASLILGLIILWSTYRVAEILFSGQQLVAVTAAVLVAGWPQFLYMSRAINNGLLATALSVVTLVILLESRRPERYIKAALLASLAVLAKLTASFTIVAVLLTYSLELWLEDEDRKSYVGPGIGMLAVFLLLAGLIATEPTLQTNFLRGFRFFSDVAPAATTLSYWVEVVELTASSGWARFGWMNVAAPAWQVYGWWLFILVATVLGVYALKHSSGQTSRIILFTIILWSGGVFLSYARINLNRLQPQFRYAFTLLPVLGAFAGAGYLYLFRRQRRLALIALVSLLVLVNLWMVFRLIIPIYYA